MTDAKILDTPARRAVSAPPGRLVGVSLGPGDPQLITRAAWAALQGPGRWTYPLRGRGVSSYALEIVRRAGLPIPGDAEALHFPMTREPAILEKAWHRAAEQALAWLNTGRDLLFLVEGDASTYSTFGHLARAVGTLAPEIPVDILPGVPAYVAAAARTGRPLAEEDETFGVVPAAYGIAVIDRLLDEFDTLVLLKVKPLLPEIIALLAGRGLLEESRFLEKLGAPEERLVEDLGQLGEEKVNYLSLILVRNPKRARGELRRGCRRAEGVVEGLAEGVTP